MKSLILLLGTFTMLLSTVAYAYLTPTAGFSTTTSVVEANNGTVGAPSIHFLNSTDAGYYRIGANDIGLAVAGILGLEAKKATGSFVNFGIGGAASVSNSFPLLIERTNSGTLTQAQISNPSTDAQSGSGFELLIDNGAGSFMVQLRGTASVAPDAYAGGAGILRTSGTVPGINLVADDVATGKIKMYAAGNGATDEIVRVHPTGLQLMTQNAKPTCVVSLRGTMYYVRAAGGASDHMDICMKKADDTYAWVAGVTAP